MEITTPDVEAAATLADSWVALAREQRRFDSRILPATNGERVRETMARRIVADEVLVASADGEYAGFVDFGVTDGAYELDARRGVVRHLYVRPERRDEGVGSALLAAAERRLADREVDAVALEAMAANDDARRFYRRHGYRPQRVTLEKSVGGDEGDDRRDGRDGAAIDDDAAESDTL